MNPATAHALQAGINGNRGAELYVDNCAACLRTDGEGSLRVFPEIAGNSTVLSDDATSLIRLVLVGSGSHATASAPSRLSMPGFASRLSDQEVAQLATFVRQNWGDWRLRRARGQRQSHSRFRSCGILPAATECRDQIGARCDITYPCRLISGGTVAILLACIRLLRRGFSAF